MPDTVSVNLIDCTVNSSTRRVKGETFHRQVYFDRAVLCYSLASATPPPCCSDTCNYSAAWSKLLPLSFYVCVLQGRGARWRQSAGYWYWPVLRRRLVCGNPPMQHDHDGGERAREGEWRHSAPRKKPKSVQFVKEDLDQATCSISMRVCLFRGKGDCMAKSFFSFYFWHKCTQPSHTRSQSHLSL